MLRRRHRAASDLRAVLLLGLPLLAGSCIQSESPLEWTTESGWALRDIVGSEDPVVVLVVDPGQCFTCYSVLAEWFDWRDGHPDEFLLLFSRRPTSTERRSLQRLRLREAGSLSSRVTIDAAIELLATDSAVLAMHHVRSGQTESRLLDLIGDRTLRDAVENLRVDVHSK